MARFEAKSIALGVIQDLDGDVVAGQPFTLSGGPLYAAETGGTTLTGGSLVYGSTPPDTGKLPGWFDPDTDPGIYSLTVGTQTVKFMVGDSTRVDSLESTGIGTEALQAGTVGAPTEKMLWRFQPVDTAKAPFTWHIHGASFNGTWDTVMYFGYNATGAGGRVLAAEPSFRFVIEQDYEVTEGTHWLEAYVEWIPGSGATAPASGRPLFWRFDRATGSIVGFDIKSKGIQFTDWGDDASFASIGGRDGSYIAAGHTGQTANTQLSLTAQNAKDVALSMSSAKGSFSIIQVATNQWGFTVGGLAFMQVGQSLGNPIGFGNADVGQNAAVAIQLKDDVKTFWPTLKLKAISGQDQNLLSLQDSANVEIAAFTVTGALQLNEQTAPAAPAANKVRVYAEDNGSGKTKLMARFPTGAAVQLAIEP